MTYSPVQQDQYYDLSRIIGGQRYSLDLPLLTLGVSWSSDPAAPPSLHCHYTLKVTKLHTSKRQLIRLLTLKMPQGILLPSPTRTGADLTVNDCWSNNKDYELMQCVTGSKWQLITVIAKKNMLLTWLYALARMEVFPQPLSPHSISDTIDSPQTYSRISSTICSCLKPLSNVNDQVLWQYTSASYN